MLVAPGVHRLRYLIPSNITASGEFVEPFRFVDQRRIAAQQLGHVGPAGIVIRASLRRSSTKWILCDGEAFCLHCQLFLRQADIVRAHFLLVEIQSDQECATTRVMAFGDVLLLSLSL